MILLEHFAKSENGDRREDARPSAGADVRTAGGSRAAEPGLVCSEELWLMLAAERREGTRESWVGMTCESSLHRYNK